MIDLNMLKKFIGPIKFSCGILINYIAFLVLFAILYSFTSMFWFADVDETLYVLFIYIVCISLLLTILNTWIKMWKNNISNQRGALKDTLLLLYIEYIGVLGFAKNLHLDMILEWPILVVVDMINRIYRLVQLPCDYFVPYYILQVSKAEVHIVSMLIYSVLVVSVFFRVKIS